MMADFDRHRLLAMLPLAERQALSPHVKPIMLSMKEELNLVGSPLRHLYFPLDAAISVMDMAQSGRVLEVAVVGKEGCFCPDVLNGLTASPTHTIVQIGGASLCVDTAVLAGMLSALPVFGRRVRRCSALLFRHAVISVGCSQWHSVEGTRSSNGCPGGCWRIIIGRATPFSPSPMNFLPINWGPNGSR